MTADTAPAWPDPARPGVPTIAELDGFHWLLKRNGAWPEAWLWLADADGCGTEYSGGWAESDGDGQPETMARWYSYLGPARTPSEVTALVEAARREEREAIARDVDCGCDVKPIVLANLASHGEREAWRCCGQHYDACLAIQAAAIRARSTEEQA